MSDLFFSKTLFFIDEVFFLPIFSIILFIVIFLVIFIFLKIVFFRISIFRNFFFWLFFFVVFITSYFAVIFLLLPNHEKYYPKEKVNFTSTLWKQNRNRYRMVLNHWEKLEKLKEIEITRQLGEPLQNINKEKFDNADMIYEISSPSFIFYVKSNRTNHLNEFLGIRRKFLLIWFRKNKNKIEIRDLKI